MSVLERDHQIKMQTLDNERAQITTWYQDASESILRARDVALNRRNEWVVSKRVEGECAKRNNFADDPNKEWDWFDTELFPYEQAVITPAQERHIFNTVSFF